MIAPLHPLLDDADVRSRVDRGVVDDLREVRLVDVIRTAARDQRPARIQQLQRAQVDLLVAGVRAGDRRLVLGERRRVEHDGVESLAEPLHAAQLVEHVADARVDGDAVPRGVPANASHRVLRHVDGDRLLAAPPRTSAKPPL